MYLTFFLILFFSNLISATNNQCKSMEKINVNTVYDEKFKKMEVPNYAKSGILCDLKKNGTSFLLDIPINNVEIFFGLSREMQIKFGNEVTLTSHQTTGSEIYFYKILVYPKKRNYYDRLITFYFNEIRPENNIILPMVFIKQEFITFQTSVPTIVGVSSISLTLIFFLAIANYVAKK
jgi:hypothetical protein